MTTKSTGVIAAGFLAIGIVVGTAGTIVARDDAAPDMAGHRRGSLMGGGSMDGISMMSMMGGGSPMRPSTSMGPDASMSPEDHESHHMSPSPAATR